MPPPSSPLGEAYGVSWFATHVEGGGWELCLAVQTHHGVGNEDADGAEKEEEWEGVLEDTVTFFNLLKTP